MFSTRRTKGNSGGRYVEVVLQDGAYVRILKRQQQANVYPKENIGENHEIKDNPQTSLKVSERWRQTKQHLEDLSLKKFCDETFAEFSQLLSLSTDRATHLSKLVLNHLQNSARPKAKRKASTKKTSFTLGLREAVVFATILFSFFQGYLGGFYQDESITTSNNRQNTLASSSKLSKQRKDSLPVELAKLPANAESPTVKFAPPPRPPVQFAKRRQAPAPAFRGPNRPFAVPRLREKAQENMLPPIPEEEITKEQQELMEEKIARFEEEMRNSKGNNQLIEEQIARFEEEMMNSRRTHRPRILPGMDSGFEDDIIPPFDPNSI